MKKLLILTFAILFIVTSLLGCSESTGTKLTAASKPAADVDNAAKQELESERKMNRQLFWEIIEKAKNGSRGNMNRQRDMLIGQLSQFSDEDILNFYAIQCFYYDAADKERVVIACAIVNDGTTDDGFEYFRGWLIAQGETVYKSVLLNPDNLADVCEPSGQLFYFEEMSYIAREAYNKKHGIVDDIDTFYEKSEEHLRHFNGMLNPIVGSGPRHELKELQSACDNVLAPTFYQKELAAMAKEIVLASDINVDIESKVDDYEKVFPKLAKKFKNNVINRINYSKLFQ